MIVNLTRNLLVDVETNETTWRDPDRSESYEKLLTVQDHVAQQVIAGLKTKAVTNRGRTPQLDVAA